MESLSQDTGYRGSPIQPQEESLLVLLTALILKVRENMCEKVLVGIVLQQLGAHEVVK